MHNFANPQGKNWFGCFCTVKTKDTQVRLVSRDDISKTYYHDNANTNTQNEYIFHEDLSVAQDCTQPIS